MSQQRWSQKVSQSSHALELEPGVFTQQNPAAIARSLWRSAERSPHKKRTAYGSAMAMLCFYINRAGRRLSPKRRQLLLQAKQELRNLRLNPQQAPAGHGQDSAPAWADQPRAGRCENWL